jgi:alkylated DNA nucleotide flippase Atl1
MAIRLKGRTPWRQKLEKPQEAKVVDVPLRMQKAWGSGRMVIATPMLVDELVRRIPKGRLATVAQLMARLAKDHHCDSTCPMTTGIFLRIVAETAEEDMAAGRRRIAPYWRVLKSDGSLNERYPGGVNRQAGHLRSEGHKVVSVRPGRARVADFARRLAKL